MRKIQDRARCREPSQHRPHLPQGCACSEAHLMEKVTCEAPGLISHHTSCTFFNAALVFHQQFGKKLLKTVSLKTVYFASLVITEHLGPQTYS